LHSESFSFHSQSLLGHASLAMPMHFPAVSSMAFMPLHASPPPMALNTRLRVYAADTAHDIWPCWFIFHSQSLTATHAASPLFPLVLHSILFCIAALVPGEAAIISVTTRPLRSQSVRSSGLPVCTLPFHSQSLVAMHPSSAFWALHGALRAVIASDSAKALPCSWAVVTARSAAKASAPTAAEDNIFSALMGAGEGGEGELL